MSGMDFYYNQKLFGDVTNGYANKPARQQETAIEMMLERNIAELAVNRFKYENLPESIPQRFIEIAMLLGGQVVFYWEDKFDKLICAKAGSSGYVNFADEPTSFTVLGPGLPVAGVETDGVAFLPKTIGAYIPMVHADKPDEFKRRRGIAMYPNYFRTSEMDIIKIYAQRLAVTDRTLEINTKNARRTKVLMSNQARKLSIANLSRQIDEGVEAVQIDGALNPDSVITALDLGIDPESFDKLHVLRTRWWNECMGLLGIDNANQDKKERLVAAEVGANDSQTDSMRFVSLNARRDALKRVNDVFGTNIKVDFNVEVEKRAEQLRQQTVGNQNEPNSEESDNG